jgi:hypothetical protein
MRALKDVKMTGQHRIRRQAAPIGRRGWRRAAAMAVSIMIASAGGYAIAQTAPAENLPAPSPDPRNISGIWFGTGYYEPSLVLFRPMEGGDPPYTPAGLALATRRLAADKAGHPIHHGVCIVNGFPLAANGAPFQVIQTPGRIYSVAEADHDARIVYMDRDHPAHVTPTYRGDSVGHWEGDTLVIDTIGFRPDIWLDSKGTPASGDLHVIEHLKKTNNGKVLDAVITLIDPVNYTHPWSIHRRFLWRPAEHIGEEICEESSVPEPGDDGYKSPTE